MGASPLYFTAALNWQHFLIFAISLTTQPWGRPHCISQLHSTGNISYLCNKFNHSAIEASPIVFYGCTQLATFPYLYNKFNHSAIEASPIVFHGCTQLATFPYLYNKFNHSTIEASPIVFHSCTQLATFPYLCNKFNHSAMGASPLYFTDALNWHHFLIFAIS